MKTTTSFLAQDGFIECLAGCTNNKEFVDQFDRLLGCKIGDSIWNGIPASESDLEKFVVFVDEHVYQPMVTTLKKGAS